MIDLRFIRTNEHDAGPVQTILQWRKRKHFMSKGVVHYFEPAQWTEWVDVTFSDDHI